MRERMRWIVLAGLTAAVAGCGSFVSSVDVGNLPPQTRAAMTGIKVYAAYQPEGIKYDTMAPVDATSCKSNVWDPPASQANAMEQLKYRALEAGANALIGVSCSRTGLDYGSNCWQSVVCSGTAVRAAKSSAVAYLPAPEASPSPQLKAPDATPWATPPASAGAYYALVIGNNDYRRINSLKTAVRDARAVGDMLNRKYGFRTTILTNATRGSMLAALDEFRAKLGPADSLLIYYAGHGWLDAEAERGFWLPIDAEEDSRANWLSNADISDTLKAIRAQHVMVVADSCYSGTLTRDAGRGITLPTAPEARLERMRSLRSRTALTSGGLEPVLDGGGGGHSVFARAFLTTLEENDGMLDGTDLFQRVRNRVRLNAEQSPQYSNIRFTGHQVGGDFIFQARRAAATGAGKGS